MWGEMKVDKMEKEWSEKNGREKEKKREEENEEVRPSLLFKQKSTKFIIII